VIQRLKSWILNPKYTLLFLPLVPLSYIWGFIVALRRWLYEKKILPSYRSKVPVISIGNITSGGTGKTPFIDLLLDRLNGAAVVSRGYGAQCTGNVTAKGTEIIKKTDHDETRLLAQHHPQTLFALSKSKKEAVCAVEKDARLILLDDGFQHFQVQRDLDVVVLNALDLFGNGYVLPRGILRESKKALKNADLIVLNYATDSAVEQVRVYSDAPIICCKPVVTGYIDALTSKPVQRPNRVVLVSAIGSPESFQKTVESEGITVFERFDFPDHSKIDFSRIDMKGADSLLISEKDWVRQTLPEKTIIVAQMKLKVLSGEEHLEMVTNIR